MVSSATRLVVATASRWSRVSCFKELSRPSALQSIKFSRSAMPKVVFHRGFSSNQIPTTLEELAQFRQNQQQEQLPNQASMDKLNEVDEVELKAPEKLDAEMADTIAQGVDLFIEKGGAFQRLRHLSKMDAPIVAKWQKMMEIYFTAQLQMLVNLGYPPDQQGLQMYMLQLHALMEQLDVKDRILYVNLKDMKRSTWRKCVATAFELDLKTIPKLDIVEARNQMHRVMTSMSSGEVLMEIQKRVQRISYSQDENTEYVLKHNALQDIIINRVYLGKDQILSDMGYPEGPLGYASFQVAISDFEEDPLVRDYTKAAMEKVWNAAGMDISEVMSPGLNPRHTP